MSLANSNTPAAIPNWSGSPVIDTAVNQIVIVSGSFISAILVYYMSKHGITDTKLIGFVPTVVPALLSSFVTLGFAIWSVVRKKQSVNAVVDHSTDAAISGKVPDSVKALASPAQKATMTRAGV